MISHSSVGKTQTYITDVLKPMAKKLHLNLTAFGSEVYHPCTKALGSIELSDAWGTALESAPITPTDSPAYKLLSGTIRASYADANGGEEIIVSPGMMNGNTGKLDLS